MRTRLLTGVVMLAALGLVFGPLPGASGAKQLSRSAAAAEAHYELHAQYLEDFLLGSRRERLYDFHRFSARRVDFSFSFLHGTAATYGEPPELRCYGTVDLILDPHEGLIETSFTEAADARC